MNKTFENVYEAEHAIQELIKNDNNCSAHFEYEILNFRRLKLNLITYNPKHNTHFLLFSIIENTEDKLELIKQMYEHVYTLRTTLAEKDSPYVSYTIEWYCDKTQKRIKSSFYGETIEQVLIKFNYNHDKPLTIYSMQLNPQPNI